MASGVLYHMEDPVELLARLAAVCGRLYLWTHFFDADSVRTRANVSARFDGPTERTTQGLTYTAYKFRYATDRLRGAFCGGPQPFAYWLTRDDIIRALRHFGFTEIEQGFVDRDHVHGPAFALVAQKPVETSARGRMWKLARRNVAGDAPTDQDTLRRARRDDCTNRRLDGRKIAMSVLPSPSKSPPDRNVARAAPVHRTPRPVLDMMMYQPPFDGRKYAMSDLPSPSKSPETGMSLGPPQLHQDALSTVLDMLMYQPPSDGRKTAMSVLPSPS